MALGPWGVGVYEHVSICLHRCWISVCLCRCMYCKCVLVFLLDLCQWVMVCVWISKTEWDECEVVVIPLVTVYDATGKFKAQLLDISQLGFLHAPPRLCLNAVLPAGHFF